MRRNATKQWLAAQLLLAATVFTTTITAQTTETDVRVINEIDTVWHFGFQGINLYSRPIHRIDIAYPSKDLKGNPVELSGYVAIPADLYSGEQPVDGIVLNNHFTQLSYDGAPTRGNAEGEDLAIANPLLPNYIVVCSDFYGFGITEGQGQYFCYGTANGQASIDCLLAARKLLDQRGISQGRFLVNVGYSSGGYDAIATQKLRDMYYSDQIFFDKTLVGGFPFDMVDAFNTYIERKDDPSTALFGVLMILDSYNKHADLGLDLPSMMNEPLASNFEEWFQSGKYTTAEANDSLKGLTLAEVLKDTLYRSDSPVFKKLKKAMQKVALENDWEPDTLQNYYVTSVIKDNIVPASSCRAFANFLAYHYYEDLGDSSPLFDKSIIPEKTHLQTNFVINSTDHVTAGGLAYYLNLAATLAALPVLYYDGELNTHYSDLVKDFSVMQIIKKLEAAGIDVKGIVKERLASSGDGGSGGGLGGIFDLLASLDEKLKPLNLTSVELLQIADDSGLSLEEIAEIYTYLTEEEALARATNTDFSEPTPAKRTMQKRPLPGTPDYYLFFLENWLKENHVNIYEKD
jgi:hypothetical protein